MNQISELIKHEKAMRAIRRKQIKVMYMCIQTFNVARIVIAIGVVFLILFK